MNNDFVEAQELINLRYENANSSQGSIRYIDLNVQFHQQLENVFLDPEKFSALQFLKFPIHIILQYLQNTHIFYTNKYLNEIAHLIDGLSFKSNHQSWKPILSKIFNDYSRELIRHIEQEELELFPYVNSMLAAMQKGIAHFGFKRKLNLADHLLHHSDDVEQTLEMLISLLENKPDLFDNTLSLNVLLTKLKIFKRDLTIHAKLEDEVLLPRAIELEKIISLHPDTF